MTISLNQVPPAIRRKGIKLCPGEWNNNPKMFCLFCKEIYQQSRIIFVVKSSGCVNRSEDYHSVPTSQDFVLGEFFVSSVSSHSISSRVNSKLDNFKFSNSISPKHVCTHVKFYRLCQKSKNPKSHHRCKSQQDSHFPKFNSGGQKLPEPRARARPHAHAHTRYIY